MIIEANNTIDGFQKALGYLKALPFRPADSELGKESPLLIVFKNLMSDSRLPDYDGSKFTLKVDYEDVIGETKDFVNHEFVHYENLLNQKIVNIVDYLKKNSFSKRAIINVWSDDQRDLDNSAECLVYLLFRQILKGLDLHVHMRANNAKNKALLNFHIFASIQKFVAKKLNLKISNYCHYTNSYHIYRQ